MTAIYDITFDFPAVLGFGLSAVVEFGTLSNIYDEDVLLKTLHKNFPLKISLVNVTKSAENCGFGHIYWKNS